MRKKRRTFSASFKAKVALEAAKEIKTVKDLSTQYELSPAQITDWKKHLVSSMPTLFESSKKKAKDIDQSVKEIARLYEEIGRLKMERDYLGKKIDQYG